MEIYLKYVWCIGGFLAIALFVHNYRTEPYWLGFLFRAPACLWAVWTAEKLFKLPED